MFYFAFGAPKVREVDATVGGIRVPRDRRQAGMPAARKIMPCGYLTDVAPGPVFVGVEKPMKVYSFDNILFTNAKVTDDFVYKFIDTMEKNKADLIAVAAGAARVLGGGGYKQYDVPYHPGALEILQGARTSQPKAIQ